MSSLNDAIQHLIPNFARDVTTVQGGFVSQGEVGYYFLTDTLFYAPMLKIQSNLISSHSSSSFFLDFNKLLTH